MGKLVQVSKSVISSAVSSLAVDGIDSDNVYMVVANGIKINTNTAYIKELVVKDNSGSQLILDGYSYYNHMKITMRANSSINSYMNANRPALYFAGAAPISNDVTGEQSNGIWWLYNFNNSSGLSYVFGHNTVVNSSQSTIHGDMGGFVYEQSEALTGFALKGESCTLTEGSLTLYKVVK